MAYLITGQGFKPVLAQDDVDYYGGLAGGVTGVLPIGGKMAYSLPDANTVRLSDGVLVSKEGRRIHIRAGEYDDFTIPNGTQGATAYYIIGYHIYINEQSKELVETFVQSVAGASSTIAENKIRDGYTEVFVSVYRVKQEGVSISTVSRVCKVFSYPTDLLNKINAVQSDLDAHFIQSGRKDGTVRVSGTLTSAGKSILFTLHPTRPLDPAVTQAKVVGMYAKVRQNGKYLYGSASNFAAVDPDEIQAYIGNYGVNINWTHATAFTGAVNNSGVEMELDVRINYT